MIRLPSKGQAGEVVRRVKRETGVQIMNSLSWRSWLKRYQATLLLKSMGVEEATKFLRSWYMFVPTRSGLILCPHEIGQSSRKTVRVRDFVALAHELTHKEQCGKLGVPHFEKEYFLTPESRAIFEGEAKAAGADVWRLFGFTQNLSPDMVFTPRWSEAYKLNRTQTKLAVQTYRRSIAAHDRGKYAEPMGSLVCEIIKDVMQ